MSPLRCAAYARYSIDKQNPLSISDQLRKCREFAASQGWDFLYAHTYVDEAVSGATDDRAGLAALLASAASPERPFDVVLVDDTSRLSRKLADSLRIFEQLKFASIRVIYVSQGIDTDSEQAELLLATHGIVDSLYIRELAKKVHHGVEGRALQGLHTGGRCFGYRSVPVEDSTRRDTYGRPLRFILLALAFLAAGWRQATSLLGRFWQKSRAR
jgi:DNA invertase Pin-like site-specific DNA recombinase